MKKRAFIAVVFTAVVLAGAIWGQSEWKVRQLTQPQEHLNAQGVPPQARAAWPQQNRMLSQLWLARQKRDVTPELLKLLKSSQHPEIRHRTVRALGRIENPKALGPLKAWEKTLTPQQKEEFYPTLPLAIARIQSHNLKGQKKLEALSKSVSLSWSETVRLSQKVNAPRSQNQNTSGGEIVREVVDTLYLLGKRGERVNKISSQLLLAPSQSALINSANLSPQKQVAFLISYLDGVNMEGYGDSELANRYLISIPGSNVLLVKYLQGFKNNPQSHIARAKPKLPHLGYTFLFEAAALTRDKQVPILLKAISSKFKPSWDKNSDVNSNPQATVYFFAQQAQHIAEDKREYPILP